MQDLLDEIDDLPGGDVGHLALALDIFGIDIYNHLYGVSALHFLANQIGQGPFLRVDMGLARHVAEAEALGEEDEEASDWGPGILLGGGYGIPVTSGTRLLVNANYSLRRVEGETTSSLVLSLNGLF